MPLSRYQSLAFFVGTVLHCSTTGTSKKPRNSLVCIMGILSIAMKPFHLMVSRYLTGRVGLGVRGLEQGVDVMRNMKHKVYAKSRTTGNCGTKTPQIIKYAERVSWASMRPVTAISVAAFVMNTSCTSNIESQVDYLSSSNVRD